MQKTPTEFVEIGKADKVCEFHGEYKSTLFECQPSQAPEVLRQHWTNCPPCNVDYQRYTDKLLAESMQGASAKEVRARQRVADAGVPARFVNCTVENWLHPMDKQRRVWAWVSKYCHEFAAGTKTSISAAMIGHPGTGKTHLAIGILKRVMRDGGTGRYTTVMDMLGRIKDTYHHHARETEAKVIADLTGVDLLVVDEVGKQLDTNYEMAQLFRIIDTRYRDLKPIILVSNLNRPKLAEFVGEAIIDRLCENGGKVLGFDWGSHRRKSGGHG
jgi:DNA replication protein DnaC